VKTPSGLVSEISTCKYLNSPLERKNTIQLLSIEKRFRIPNVYIYKLHYIHLSIVVAIFGNLKCTVIDLKLGKISSKVVTSLADQKKQVRRRIHVCDIKFYNYDRNGEYPTSAVLCSKRMADSDRFSIWVCTTSIDPAQLHIRMEQKVFSWSMVEPHGWQFYFLRLENGDIIIRHPKQTNFTLLTYVSNYAEYVVLNPEQIFKHKLKVIRNVFEYITNKIFITAVGMERRAFTLFSFSLPCDMNSTTTFPIRLSKVCRVKPLKGAFGATDANGNFYVIGKEGKLMQYIAVYNIVPDLHQ
jgi:hypothetical protein